MEGQFNLLGCCEVRGSVMQLHPKVSWDLVKLKMWGGIGQNKFFLSL